jgi:hypothetical protein
MTTASTIKIFQIFSFHLGAKSSFRRMVDAQLVKVRKSYSILRFIHKCISLLRYSKNETFPNVYVAASLYFGVNYNGKLCIKGLPKDRHNKQIVALADDIALHSSIKYAIMYEVNEMKTRKFKNFLPVLCLFHHRI